MLDVGEGKVEIDLNEWFFINYIKLERINKEYGLAYITISYDENPEIVLKLCLHVSELRKLKKIIDDVLPELKEAEEEEEEEEGEGE